MIPRRIMLKGKTGHNEYMCSGSSCDTCKLRFECFTEDREHILWLEWDELHAKYRGISPSRVLKDIIGSKVWVEGSRKFRESMEKARSLVPSEQRDIRVQHLLREL